MTKYTLPCRADEITEASVAAEAATGKAYLHSRTDVHGRPVIVIRVEKHITSTCSRLLQNGSLTRTFARAHTLHFLYNALSKSGLPVCRGVSARG